jgi:hypothetical protein
VPVDDDDDRDNAPAAAPKPPRPPPESRHAGLYKAKTTQPAKPRRFKPTIARRASGPAASALRPAPVPATRDNEPTSLKRQRGFVLSSALGVRKPAEKRQKADAAGAVVLPVHIEARGEGETRLPPARGDTRPTSDELLSMPPDMFIEYMKDLHNL